jgi:hypothetical protein
MCLNFQHWPDNNPWTVQSPFQSLTVSTAGELGVGDKITFNFDSSNPTQIIVTGTQSAYAGNGIDWNGVVCTGSGCTATGATNSGLKFVIVCTGSGPETLNCTPPPGPFSTVGGPCWTANGG